MADERQLATVAYRALLSGIGVHMGLLFSALARAAEQRLERFNAQDLANTVWAFAKAELSEELLFVVLPRLLERRLSDFNEQNLSNTAWAFAVVAVSD